MRAFDIAELDQALRRLRNRLRRRRWLNALAVAALAGAGARLFDLGAPLCLFASLCVFAAMLVIQSVRGKRQWPDAMSLAEHLNRTFPLFEESAQLLLSGTGDTHSVKDIQRRRAEAAWQLCIPQRDKWLPPRQLTRPLLTLFLAVVILLFAHPLRALLAPSIARLENAPGTAATASTDALQAAQVVITPPAYTGLPTRTLHQLDLELVAGSEVTWVLDFNSPGNYWLELSDREPVKLSPDSEGRARTSAVIDSTALYRLLSRTAQGETRLIGVHSLKVSIDQAPSVRIIEPASTSLEIAANETARFQARVHVSDDYGIGDVEIRASVASGLGEGVKFRDEVLAFDRSMIDDNGVIYQRSFDMKALGMEPGDEIYFFVSANDNRTPSPNQGRSDTVIVRWLDEDQEGAAAEGIAIDFMPEYFKSQRQIIIETEELIADRDRLAPDVFDKESQTLGQHQSSLKQRYGQYLGDETEGAAPAPDAEAEQAEDQAGREPDPHAPVAHRHDDGDLAGHDHEDSPGSSARELIEQYTHEHEAAEIGPITERNPVGLMKRALSNMWQAELHLLLSEPEQALPFEYDALKYLNMARQAERIYTQRLGFEPPPVTEERRNTGDIDTVEPYQHSEQAVESAGDQELFRAAYTILQGATPPGPQQTAILRSVRDRLTGLAQERPGLLDLAAGLERWLADPDGTTTTRADLRTMLWSLLQGPSAPAEPGARVAAVDDPMTLEYARTRTGTAAAARGDQP